MPIDDDDIRALLDHGTPVPPEKFDTLVAFARRVLDSAGTLDVPVATDTYEQIGQVADVLDCDMAEAVHDGRLVTVGLRLF